MISQSAGTNLVRHDARSPQIQRLVTDRPPLGIPPGWMRQLPSSTSSFGFDKTRSRAAVMLTSG